VNHHQRRSALHGSQENATTEVPPRTTDLRELATIVRNTTIAQCAASSLVQQSR